MLTAFLPFLAPLWLAAQAPQTAGDPSVVVSPVMHWPLSTVVNLSDIQTDWWPEMRNTWVAPRPGMDVPQELHEALKEAAIEWVEEQAPAKTAGPEDTLNLQTVFFGNAYDGGIPNDNGIAVGKGQKVVSVANSTIRVYQGSSSAPQLSASLAGFANGVGGGATKYDPKVTYDPIRDRFIVVYLNGFLASNSVIIVAFSQTEDPSGNWNVYGIDGSATTTTWTDFPQIAITRDELFITGNLFTDGGNAQGSVIWQIQLNEGFDGQPLVSRNFITNFFSLHPVEESPIPGGPNMYFIRTVSNPIPTSKSVFVHEMTNTIAAGGVLNAPILLNSDLSYGPPPDATQKGTTIKLDCNECRVQTSYKKGDRIEAAWNTVASGKTCIYHLTITMAEPISFSQAKGQYVKIDSLSLAYPGIAPGGCTGANGENSSVLMMNYCSPNQFPGCAAVFIDTSNTIGPLKVLKTGFTYMGDSSPWRWGDYADAAPRTNNPGEVWIGGSVGMMGGGQHRNGTYISKVFTQCCAGPIAIDDMHQETNEVVAAFPSPANELIFFTFDVPRFDQYRVTIVDVEGRPVQEIVNDRLKQGKAQLRFSTAPLASGLYVVKVESGSGIAMSRRFVVAH